MFKRFNPLNLNSIQKNNIFSNVNIQNNNIFKNYQDDEENEIIIINDEKTELRQIKEIDNDSRSVTERSIKSRKESQINLRENINLIEEKKDDTFLRPHDINLNSRSEKNIINIFKKEPMDFETQVNKKYGLFPII